MLAFMTKRTPPTGSTLALLKECKAFCANYKVPPTRFGRDACGDASLLRRLAAGKSVTLTTADAVRAYMERERRLRATRIPSGAPGRSRAA